MASLSLYPDESRSGEQSFSRNQSNHINAMASLSSALRSSGSIPEGLVVPRLSGGHHPFRLIPDLYYDDDLSVDLPTELLQGSMKNKMDRVVQIKQLVMFFFSTGLLVKPPDSASRIRPFCGCGGLQSNHPRRNANLSRKPNEKYPR